MKIAKFKHDGSIDTTTLKITLLKFFLSSPQRQNLHWSPTSRNGVLSIDRLARSVTLTTKIHLVASVRMNGAISTVCLHAVDWNTEEGCVSTNPH